MRDALPDTLLGFLSSMERVTGRMPVTKVITAIVMVGTLITAGVMGAAWWFERVRAQQAFSDMAQRVMTQAQDQLAHKQLMVHQSAVLAGDLTASLSLKGAPATRSLWVASDVLLIQGVRFKPEWLADAMKLDLSTAQFVSDCAKALTPIHPVSFCHASFHQDDRVLLGWLVERVSAPGSGWVISPLQMPGAPALASDASGWQLQTTWRDERWAPRTVPFGFAIQYKLRVADASMVLSVAGQEHAGSTVLGVMSRQAGMWIAGGAGVLFTLAALHGYLMLISTRQRARDMAREMGSALQRTQARNQTVMDTAPDAIIMSNERGEVSWCNKATTSIFGKTLEDLSGQTLEQILPALKPQELDNWFMTQGFSNRVIGFETTGQRNEGPAFPVEVSASRAELDGEHIYTFIVRDTTDAKWAEQELALRDRALASSADGVIITSMTLPNHPIIYVNRAFEHITGYEAHEVLGMNCRFLQRDDVDQPGLQIMREALGEGRGCQVVLRNYRKDGGMFYNEMGISPVLNPEGVLTHYVGVQTDITDRIAAEQVLRLRTERLNAVFDLSPDGFVVLDKRGEVSIVNPSFERMTGMLAADLVGQSLSAFDEQLMARCQSSELDEREALRDSAVGSELDGGNLSRGELLHMHTPCTRTLVRRIRHGGHDNEIVMYFRDITHELEVDRMKSEFLAMAAHELRTPMVSIFGFTELLLKKAFTEDRRKDMLSTIHKQASILINLVNELLDLARIESRRGQDFKREGQSLQPIIEHAVGALLVHNDARQVAYSLPSEAIGLDVDRDKLSLALTNVLSNAFKYSPQGGDIELDLVWRDREGQPECGIRVTDHGLGMTPEQVAQVFDRFFRADTSGNIPGTGLGMTIVKEIVELHGGQVGVVSELGVGTTVTLWLPVKASLCDPVLLVQPA
jgi:PAS domain S-box-containing protein